MEAQPLSHDAIPIAMPFQPHPPLNNPTLSAALPASETSWQGSPFSNSHSHVIEPALESPPPPPLDYITNFSQGPLSAPAAPLGLASSLSHSTKESSPLSEPDTTNCPIEFDYDGPQGHRVLRLKPTVSQWSDFPTILDFARRLGADEDGCFKMVLPQDLQEPLPEKYSQKVQANAYRPTQIKKNSFWRVDTVVSEGTFASDEPGLQYTDTALEAFNHLRKMFTKSNRKQIRNVRYRVDVPAWTPEQRRQAGVPERSPIYPLEGDKLDQTKAVIPGIHTPYVYESGPYFGASFQIHAEDFRLVSLNHLYKGRKIWITIPSTAFNIAEEALGRKGKCSQFMRHRAEFFFPQKLEKMGIPFRIVDQRAGETIVILPDAYHEGFSTGYTIAEAKNYADAAWTTETYQACEEKCQLMTAIPADLMMLLKEGEERVDLCQNFEVMTPPLIETGQSHESSNGESIQDHVKLSRTLQALSKAMKKRRNYGSDETDNGVSKRVRG